MYHETEHAAVGLGTQPVKGSRRTRDRSPVEEPAGHTGYTAVRRRTTVGAVAAVGSSTNPIAAVVAVEGIADIADHIQILNEKQMQCTRGQKMRTKRTTRRGEDEKDN